jgi:hypothetical protein
MLKGVLLTTNYFFLEFSLSTTNYFKILNNIVIYTIIEKMPFGQLKESKKAATKEKSNKKKIYLFVPYEYKDLAKQEGAKWDPERKRWYATPDKLEQNGIQRENAGMPHQINWI